MCKLAEDGTSLTVTVDSTAAVLRLPSMVRLPTRRKPDRNIVTLALETAASDPHTTTLLPPHGKPHSNKRLGSPTAFVERCAGGRVYGPANAPGCHLSGPPHPPDTPAQ